MIASERILPLRIYTDLYEQNRFKKYCHDKCPTIMTYSANRLPSFQFKRAMSLDTIEKFFLKNVCNDEQPNGIPGVSYYKLIPESDSNFQQGTNYFGSFPKQQGMIDPGPPIGVLEDAIEINICNKLVGMDINPAYTFDTPAELTVDTSSTIGFTNKVKMVVDKFFLNTGSTFKIKFYDGTTAGTLVYEIDSVGVHVFEYACTQSVLTIAFDEFGTGDEFEISQIQVMQEVLGGSLYDTDAELDETQIEIIPLMDGTDVVALCSAQDLTQDFIQNGEYYYVIKTTGGEYFFSETFLIKTPKELESYYKLKWYNTCDLENSVIYKESILACGFYNEVYLEASLFTPTYETRDDVKENGQGDLTSVIRTWQKSTVLDVVRSPEYLTDALTAIFLHDRIFIQEPLNQFQEEQQEEYQIARVTSEVTDIIDDCMQRVSLKIVLSEKYVNVGCCNTAEVHDCTPEVYRAGDCLDSGIEYTLQLTEPPSGSDGLFTCDTPAVRVLPRSNELIYDEDTSRFYYIHISGGNWVALKTMPEITSASIVSTDYVINATLIPYVFGTLEVNVDGGGWTEVITLSSDVNGDWTHNIPVSDFVGATDIKFRIKMKTMTCDWGYSDIVDAL